MVTKMFVAFKNRLGYVCNPCSLSTGNGDVPSGEFPDELGSR